jgi:hypothetical protein
VRLNPHPSHSHISPCTCCVPVIDILPSYAAGGSEYLPLLNKFLGAVALRRDHMSRSVKQVNMRRQRILGVDTRPRPPPLAPPPPVNEFAKTARAVCRQELAEGGERRQPLGPPPVTNSGSRRARDMASTVADPASAGAMNQRGRVMENKRREEVAQAMVQHARNLSATPAAARTTPVVDDLGSGPGGAVHGT